MFFYDKEKDSLRGLIEEIKTKNKISLEKFNDSLSYCNVTENLSAQAMINKAIEISKKEYDFASFVVDAMLNNDTWIMTDRTEKKELVVETVYAE